MLKDQSINRSISIAPMMGYTDRHGRFFLRQFSKHTLLYTEMIATAQLIHGDANRFLKFSSEEKPLALQLGGSEPEKLARCSEMGEDRGYDEINLNVGCPSKKVSSGNFGVCLMAEPKLVAECVRDMCSATGIPITVKCRLGIEGNYSFDKLCYFVDSVMQAGAKCIIVHARTAVLGGLSPKENREIPLLRHDLVWKLKSKFKDVEIVLNGGIQTIPDAMAHLPYLNGVMIGRAAISNPMILSNVDRDVFNMNCLSLSRIEIAEKMSKYIDVELSTGVNLGSITRHMFGLFQGRPAARHWRRYLSENSNLRNSGGRQVVSNALELMERSANIQ